MFPVFVVHPSASSCRWEMIDAGNIWKIFNQIWGFLHDIITFLRWSTIFFTETLFYLAHQIFFGEQLVTQSYRWFSASFVEKVKITESARLGIIRGREKLVLYSVNWMHPGRLISVLPLLAGLLQKQRNLSWFWSTSKNNINKNTMANSWLTKLCIQWYHYYKKR